VLTFFERPDAAPAVEQTQLVPRGKEIERMLELSERDVNKQDTDADKIDWGNGFLDEQSECEEMEKCHKGIGHVVIGIGKKSESSYHDSLYQYPDTTES
jgi:hypothetical protein